MKRMLALSLSLALLVGLLTGCGDKQGSAMAPASDFGSAAETGSDGAASQNATVESGAFSMPYNESYGWNPFDCKGLENRAVMQLIYESLFVMDPSYDPVPVLCKSYTVSEDGTVYTLELQSATFSSGDALSADDVVYSMGKAEASDRYRARFSKIVSYYASGNSVIVELTEPNDRLPCLLDFPIVKNGGGDGAVGTGPFVRNSNVLVKNAKWWQGADQLNFQTVTLTASTSAEDTRDYFEIDSVHFIYNNPNLSSAATFHSDYELWNSGGTTMQYIGFNLYSGIFQDMEVRTAVSHAIDRVRIAEAVYHNFADPACLPVAPASSMYSEELAEQFAFTSVKQATEELKKTSSFYLPEVSPSPSPSVSPTMDAEDEDEETEEIEEETYNNITMLVLEGNLSRVAAANQVAEDLRAVGFTVTVETITGSDNFLSALQAGGWDLYYGEVTLKPDFDLSVLLDSGGYLSYGGFGISDTLSELLDAARENSGNRYDLYEYLMGRGAFCPVLFLNNAVFTTRGVFTGLSPTPDSLFYQISNIHVTHN